MNHKKLCPVVNGYPNLGCACRPAIGPGRCHVTGNPPGTDTWKVGYECPCPACQRYLAKVRATLAPSVEPKP